MIARSVLDALVRFREEEYSKVIGKCIGSKHKNSSFGNTDFSATYNLPDGVCDKSWNRAMVPEAFATGCQVSATDLHFSTLRQSSTVRHLVNSGRVSLQIQHKHLDSLLDTDSEISLMWNGYSVLHPQSTGDQGRVCVSLSRQRGTVQQTSCLICRACRIPSSLGSRTGDTEADWTGVHGSYCRKPIVPERSSAVRPLIS